MSHFTSTLLNDPNQMVYSFSFCKYIMLCGLLYAFIDIHVCQMPWHQHLVSCPFSYSFFFGDSLLISIIDQHTVCTVGRFWIDGS